MSDCYSSDDCWDDGVLSRSPPAGRPARRSFDRARTGEGSSGAAQPIGSLFWANEPAGHQKYHIQKKLGKGQYGTVVGAEHRRTGKQCAIKHIDRVFFTKGDAVRTLREMRFLRQFKHPNVIRLHDIIVPRNAEAFDDVFLVTERMETDLGMLIKSKTVLDDRHNRWIIYQLLRALAYVHGANVSHRDVKPANIVLDSQCNLKLCDFGLSRADFPRESETPVFWTDYVATRWYRAPELLCSHYEQYTTQIDMWAAGCIMGELVKRRPMFPGRNVYHQIDLITNFTGTPSQRTIDHMRNEKARQHLAQQIPPKPHAQSSSKFPSLADEGLSMLHGMLAFDPRDRADAATSCKHSFFKGIRESIDESFILPPPTMLEADFTWENEGELTTSELRRKLYDEILAFHPEALARGIAAAAAKVAASESSDGQPTLAAAAALGSSTFSVDAGQTPQGPDVSAAAAAAAATAGGDACSIRAGEGQRESAQRGDGDADEPAVHQRPRDDEALDDDRSSLAESVPRRIESLPATISREEQWGHLRMGNSGETSTDYSSGTDDCEFEHAEDGSAAAAASSSRRRPQRTPSMCSLTSGSDKSEPISTVSDHAWSSHEIHAHHLFHEEPAMPKFTEETEEMIIQVGAESPGGQSVQSDGGSSVSPLSLSGEAAAGGSPARERAKTPPRPTEFRREGMWEDIKTMQEEGPASHNLDDLHREIASAFSQLDEYKDKPDSPSKSRGGDGVVAGGGGGGGGGGLPRTVSLDVMAAKRQEEDTQQKARQHSGRGGGGGGGMMSCCGGRPAQPKPAARCPACGGADWLPHAKGCKGR
jgi:serine/threonine protein kinase